MKRLFVLILFFFPIILFSQSDTSYKGIKWTQGLSWQQIKEKAKSENKYIFIDCYATWCGPCKLMDRVVFIDKSVGEFMNNKFISVKVQMDKTNNDNEGIKNWYADATKISRNFTIIAFPTFLYFSPNGDPVHKATGFRSTNDFISVGNDAFDPSKQFYSILKNFQPGKLDTSEMKGLAYAFQHSGTDLSARIAADYLKRIPFKELGSSSNLNFMIAFQQSDCIKQIIIEYLKGLDRKDFASEKNIQFLHQSKANTEIQNIVLHYINSLKAREFFTKDNMRIMIDFKENSQVRKNAIIFIKNLSKKQLYTKEIIQFISSFVEGPDDKYFDLFYKERARVDSIMGKNFASQVIDNIIVDSEVNPVIISTPSGQIPNFDKMYEVIKEKYGLDYAERNVLRGKSAFFGFRARQHNLNWNEYITSSIDLFDRFGIDTTSALEDKFTINNFVFNDLLFHCSDSGQLKFGVKLMEGVVRRNPNNPNLMDTYANILYKCGKTSDAIQWEERAKQIAIEKNMKWFVNAFTIAISKMKNGEPTWIVPE